MKKAVVLFYLVLLSTKIPCGVTPTKTKCKSPQYLELGKKGTITCQFYKEFFAVWWYTSNDFENNKPTVQYQNKNKTGPGYESREFDVEPSGSLIINEVLLKHEDVFTVVYLPSEEELYDFINVRVIVTVKPDIPFPFIAQCVNVSNSCYAKVDETAIQCFVHGARPNVSLDFTARTVEGDKTISRDLLITPDGEGYTSTAITRNAFHFSPLLVLLVCKVSSIPGMFENNESIALVQNDLVDISQGKTEFLSIQRYERMELKCTAKYHGYVVWKKAVPPTFMQYDLLLYSVFIGEEFGEVFVNDIFLKDNLSLVRTSTDVKHEGLYYCIFGNGLNDGVKIFDVAVTVPAFPIIDGCHHRQYCVLKAHYDGNLTCTVKGIRPQVQLHWRTFHDKEATSISFTNQKLTVADNGETFDVTLVTTYRVMSKLRDRLTVECKVISSHKDLSGLTTTADLLFGNGGDHPAGHSNLPTPNRHSWVPSVIVFLLLACLICGLIVKKYVRKHRRSREEEMTPMDGENLLNTYNITEKKKMFVKELKVKYKDLSNAVQPIPFIKEKFHCVDAVIVEGGIQVLDSKGGKEQWTSLESYTNLFCDTRNGSTRRVLEGEPGYGKSTLALQFAYKWCTSVPKSLLGSVDILIFLRLRQLGGVSSIYRAIRQFMLPKDSRLTENDIENILLQGNQSVVIILDGFDEYPDKDNSAYDVTSIIAKEMFQDFQVVLTSRTFCLPNNLPASTRRFRLTGFDEKARTQYIRKVLKDDSYDRVRQIQEHLQQNPVLSDLCQVPLLFVLFVHMAHDFENFWKLNSVTSFFRYVISCFYSHLKNKMKDEHVCDYEILENDHGDLDEVAFEALIGNTGTIVWRKNQLCQKLRGEVYNQCVSIGILVEEEVLDIKDDPGTSITEHVQYTKEVRFYHQLFCEWFAAYYLSTYIQQNPNLDLSDYLRQLDPCDVQYLYRFSCGLNPESAEKVIDYLKNIDGGDKFAILCILEKTGNIDNIKETIRQLCDEGVIISGHDSLLLQRSTMQLLEIAGKNEIPIKMLQLHNCFQSVDVPASTLKTTSNLALKSGFPVKQLGMRLFNKRTSEEEYIAILEFSSMCTSLQHLGIYGSTPPHSFAIEPTLSILNSRKIKVKYYGPFRESPVYTLNLQTGRWERECDGAQCTDKDFKEMEVDWKRVGDRPIEEFREVIRGFRDQLRLSAKERGATSDVDHDLDHTKDSHEDKDIMAMIRKPRDRE